jgi:orotidine-5'-phosphate decarboxylase
MAELVIALDVPDGAGALALVESLHDVATWFKVGSVLFAAEGPHIVRDIVGRGARVFLDLKWHDIPSTVAAAVEGAAAMGVALVTVHLAGGAAMLAAASRAASGRLSVVGVGVLTSLDEAAFAQVVGRPVTDLGWELERLARIGMEAGLDGVVCSPREVARLRGALGSRALLVVPGIRRADDAAGDQVRTAEPAAAVAAGADLLVVGRPVTAAPDPRAAASAIREAMAP